MRKVFKIYWPYVYFAVLCIIMFLLPPKETWWAIPLRFAGTAIGMIIASMIVKDKRKKYNGNNK